MTLKELIQMIRESDQVKQIKKAKIETKKAKIETNKRKLRPKMKSKYCSDCQWEFITNQSYRLHMESKVSQETHRIFTQGKISQCFLCDKRFRSRESRRDHAKKHHPELIRQMDYHSQCIYEFKRIYVYPSKKLEYNRQWRAKKRLERSKT